MLTNWLSSLTSEKMPRSTNDILWPIFTSSDARTNRSGPGQYQHPASLYEAFPAAEPDVWSNAPDGTAHQNTAVGYDWQSSNSAFCRPSAATAA